jgi:hypothetical protein
MKVISRYALRILLASAVLFVFALFIGCGSKETAETPKTETAGEMQTPAPGTETAAVDWSAYANPKPGICPGCNMALDPNTMEVAMIGDKQVACCSSHCATMVAENPDKYLKAEASGEESHEGHGH